MKKLLLLLLFLPMICFSRGVLLKNQTNRDIAFYLDRSPVSACAAVPHIIGWITLPPNGQREINVRMMGCGTAESSSKEVVVYAIDALEPSKDQFKYNGMFTNHEPMDIPSWNFYLNNTMDIMYFRYYACAIVMNRSPDWNLDITNGNILVTSK